MLSPSIPRGNRFVARTRCSALPSAKGTGVPSAPLLRAAARTGLTLCLAREAAESTRERMQDATTAFRVRLNPLGQANKERQSKVLQRCWELDDTRAYSRPEIRFRRDVSVIFPRIPAARGPRFLKTNFARLLCSLRTC